MATRYEMVFNDICDKIARHVYKEGDMLPTEKEMAEHYQVSRITIQKALQILVIRGVIERIPGKGTFLKSAPEQLNVSRSGFLSLVIPNQDPEMLAVTHSVQDIASEKGYNLTIHFTDKAADNEPEILNKVVQDGTSGIILYPYASDGNACFYRDLQKKIPLVFIDKLVNGVVADAVMANNFQGIYDVTQMLIQNGHTKIAYASFGAPIATSLTERKQGYLTALADHQLPRVPTMMETGIASPQDVSRAMEHLFAIHPDITALVCASDELAFLCCEWLRETGKDVPRDVSVTGFDDSIFGHSIKPALTTVSQDFAAIGAQAVRRLLYIIDHPNAGKCVEYISSRVIMRDSVQTLNTSNI